MNIVYLILGGNEGNVLQTLQKTEQLISENVGEIVNKSHVFVTSAWGNTNQPDFLNQVFCVNTKLSATILLQKLISIELKLGRVRKDIKWTERTIDIDILFYNNDIIETEALKIPHPLLIERKFVLVPLAELAPKFIHPIYNKNIETLLVECNDKLEVMKLLVTNG